MPRGDTDIIPGGTELMRKRLIAALNLETYGKKVYDYNGGEWTIRGVREVGGTYNQHGGRDANFEVTLVHESGIEERVRL